MNHQNLTNNNIFWSNGWLMSFVSNETKLHVGDKENKNLE